MAQTKLIVTLIFCCLMAGAKAQMPDNVNSIPASRTFGVDTISKNSITVKVFSLPVEATILVNGKNKGVTPCDIFLPPGYHIFELIYNDKKDRVSAFRDLYTTKDTTLFFYLETHTIGKNSFDFFIERQTLDTSMAEIPRYSAFRYDYQTFSLPEPVRLYEWPIQLGIGTLYKFGSFSGDIGDIFTTYTTIKPLFLYLMKDGIYFDIGFSFFSVLGEMSQTKFLDQTFEGSFYGKLPEFYTEFYTSAGYRILNNNFISLTPVASFTAMKYDVFATETKVFTNFDESYRPVNENPYGITMLGPGIISQNKIWEIKEDATKISILLRYNALFVLSEKQFNLHGLVHEFTAGLILTLGPDNSK
jgi:hypothetical protein